MWKVGSEMSILATRFKLIDRRVRAAPLYWRYRRSYLASRECSTHKGYPHGGVSLFWRSVTVTRNGTKAATLTAWVTVTFDVWAAWGQLLFCGCLSWIWTTYFPPVARSQHSTQQWWEAGIASASCYVGEGDWTKHTSIMVLDVSCVRVKIKIDIF